MQSNFEHRTPHALVAIGLLGIISYQIIVRLAHPAFMENDLIHGIWFGVFLGIEILGLYLLRKSKCNRAA